MYLELFRNEVGIKVSKKFLEFSARFCDEADEVQGFIRCLARADGCVANVVRCSTGWEARGGQRQMLYAIKQRHDGTGHRIAD